MERDDNYIDKEEKGFSQLFKYTLLGYFSGIFTGFILDLSGFQKSGIGQWIVRTLSGESESIFEGIYALRQRLSRMKGSLSEAYGWGKIIGMVFPWIVDFLSRIAGIDVYGIEGFYIPYFYALSDQIGANISGMVFFKKREKKWSKAFKSYIKNPVMITSAIIIFTVPVGLFFARLFGFSPSNQVYTALETIAANLCWVPPLVGFIKDKTSN